MATGTVKWFNDSKGFGFITPSEGGEDLFAHHTAIQMSGFKTLKEGQKVEFEVKRGPRVCRRTTSSPCKSRKARKQSPLRRAFSFQGGKLAAEMPQHRAHPVRKVLQQPDLDYRGFRVQAGKSLAGKHAALHRAERGHVGRARGERSMKAMSPNVMPEVKELSRLTPFWVGTLTIAEPRVITKVRPSSARLPRSSARVDRIGWRAAARAPRAPRSQSP